MSDPPLTEEIATAETSTCVGCGEPFDVSVAERTARRGSGLPVAARCPDCRVRHRTERNARMRAAYATNPIGLGYRGAAPGPEGGAGPLRTARCTACGRTIRVPFRPRADRPLFCRACLNNRLGH